MDNLTIHSYQLLDFNLIKSLLKLWSILLILSNDKQFVTRKRLLYILYILYILDKIPEQYFNIFYSC